MLELEQAVARGKLSRVVALREERQTRSAQILLDTLDPRQWLRTVPVRFSGVALLRERYEVERAYLMMRQERRAAIEEAHEILLQVSARIGPSARASTLAGDSRFELLSALAILFSSIGDENQAIRISNYLLAEMGAPQDPAGLERFVRERPYGHRIRLQIIVQLNNLCVRRLKLGFLAWLGGDNETASDELARAHEAATVALDLRDADDEPGAAGARLLSRSNLTHIKLNQAMLLDAEAREPVLAELRAEATAIVADSYDTPTVRPKTRLVRASLLGEIVAEQSRLAAAQGDEHEAIDLGWLARVCLQPGVDLFAVDADEAVQRAVRYADACELTGAHDDAITHWQRTRDRLALFRGEDLPAVRAIDQRLARVSANAEIIRVGRGC
jgi:hypothetical protein